MSNPYQGAPDLASILKTLSSVTPHSQPQPQAYHSSLQPEQTNSSIGPTSNPYNAFSPHQTGVSRTPSQSSASAPAQAQTQAYHTPLPEQTHNPTGPTSDPYITYNGQQATTSQTPSQSKAPITKSIDPTTIIDWSSGLKCITKAIATHDNLVINIRHLIQTSHEHEQQWWTGRQALLQKQEARIEGQKKLDDALKAVGALSSVPVKPAAEVAAEELTTYDLKVYRAQHQMVKEISGRLKDLGVPFFGTKLELVRLKRDEGKEERVIWDGNVQRKLVSEEELVGLQRKMLEFLETVSES